MRKLIAAIALASRGCGCSSIAIVGQTAGTPARVREQPG